MKSDCQLQSIIDDALKILYDKFPELRDEPAVGKNIKANSNTNHIIRIMDHGKWINVEITGIEVILGGFSNEAKQILKQQKSYSEQALPLAASLRIANSKLTPNYNLALVRDYIRRKLIYFNNRKQDKCDFERLGIDLNSVCKIMMKLNSNQLIGIGDIEKYPDTVADEYLLGPEWMKNSSKSTQELWKITNGLLYLYLKFYIGPREYISEDKNVLLRKIGTDEAIIADASANFCCLISFHESDEFR